MNMNAHRPKFKAWDVARKEWIDYGFCLRFDANGNCEVLNAFAQPFEGKEIVLVQWTGLQDKQGKDIYEGDIVATARNRKAVVMYSRDAFWLNGYPFYPDTSNPFIGREQSKIWRMNHAHLWTIIDNIYEHPLEDEHKPVGRLIAQ